MTFEFDHVFICVSLGGEEAERLRAFGLIEGPPNVHPGQGTACRRFFFANSYLELLWVSDPVEAQSERTQPTRLWERWSGRNAGVCPFGIVFRAKAGHEGEVPFPAWEYHPAYLPPTLSLHVATNAGAPTEPMLVYLPLSRRPDSNPGSTGSVLTHGPGLREITRVQLTIPHSEVPSPAVASLTTSEVIGFRAGSEYLLELGFDQELGLRRADFRPSLPLEFCW